MTNIASGIIGFVAGAVAGAGTTYYVMKERMEAEIEEVRQIYRQKIEEDVGKSIEEWKNPADEYTTTAPSEKPAPAFITRNIFEDHSIQANGDYVDYSNSIKEDTDEDDEYIEEPTRIENPQIYTISPAEFGEHDDFDQVSLTWYADSILADDMDPAVPIEDIESYFPIDILSTFGEYEDDSIHVRNELLKTDYEILRDLSKWKDLYKKKKKTSNNRRPDDISQDE